MKKLFLIDASSLIFRAFYAIRSLTREDGLEVNALYGFVRMIFAIREKFAVKNMAVVFDSKSAKTFRKDLYNEYKANRAEAPEELIHQFPLIEEIVDLMGYCKLKMEGFEADDLIATYAKMAEANGMEVVIISSDKDLMQLIKDGICMYDPMKNKYIEEPDVFEKFGVYPRQMIDFQSLTGDSSDNIPGVSGVGPKGAAALLAEYETLENIFANVEKIEKKALREKLINNKEQAFLSKKLVTLVQTAVIEGVDINDFAIQKFNTNDVLEFLKAQNFQSLINKIMLEDKENFEIEQTPFIAEDSKPVPVMVKNNHVLSTDKEKLQGTGQYKTITSLEEFAKLCAKLAKCDKFALDTETDNLNAREANLLGISFSFEAKKGYYVPVKPHNGSSYLSIDEVLPLLKPILLDEGILKIGHNLKYDMHVLSKYGLEIKAYSDTMLMSYIAGGTKHKHNMNILAEIYLSYTMVKFEDIVEKGKTFADIDITKATLYAAEDSDITLRLHEIFLQKLFTKKQLNVYYNIDKPLLKILYDAEKIGMLLDSNVLKKLGDDFQSRLKILEGQIFTLAGEEFNIASPMQVGVILFEKMGLKGQKNKNGKFKTDANTLEKLAADNIEIVQFILEWRKFAKLISTYIEGLMDSTDKQTNRVHTTFMQTITNTGRLSSVDPNLQNIPVKQEEGRKIRQAFIAGMGKVLVSADYSQIELKILSLIAGVESLQEAFKNNVDIHTKTASEVLNKSLDNVTKEDRRKAKMINFGIIYGISEYGLARRINVPVEEARAYIKTYFLRYPEIKQYMEKMVKQAMENEYVETIFGRRCYILDINNNNGMIRANAERAAINAPIQGTAADIMKIAMNKIARSLKKENLQSKMLLQIHDEVIIEALEEEAEKVIQILEKEMPNIEGLNIKLDIGIKKSKFWA